MSPSAGQGHESGASPTGRMMSAVDEERGMLVGTGIIAKSLVVHEFFPRPQGPIKVEYDLIMIKEQLTAR